jgi:hypothetical protein
MVPPESISMVRVSFSSVRLLVIPSQQGLAAYFSQLTSGVVEG